MLEQIEKARSERRAIFLKQYAKPDIDWNFLVEEINLDLSRKSLDDLGDTYIWKKENDMMMKDLFYIQLIII